MDLTRIPPDTCPLCRQRALSLDGVTLTCRNCGSVAQLDPATRRTRYRRVTSRYAQFEDRLTKHWLSRRDTFDFTAPKPLPTVAFVPLIFALLSLCGLLTAATLVLAIRPSIANTRSLIDGAYATPTVGITRTASSDIAPLTSPLTITASPTPTVAPVSPTVVIAPTLPVIVAPPVRSALPTPAPPTPVPTVPPPPTPAPTATHFPTFTPLPTAPGNPTAAPATSTAQPTATTNALNSPINTPTPTATLAAGSVPPTLTPAPTATGTLTTTSTTGPKGGVLKASGAGYKSYLVTGTVYINEVRWVGAPKAADEYIDLVNESVITPVSLTGWDLKVIAANISINLPTDKGDNNNVPLQMGTTQSCRFFTGIAISPLPNQFVSCGLIGFQKETGLWPDTGGTIDLFDTSGNLMAYIIYGN